ncbi:serine protease [Pedobacter sp. MC2016-14]|uniref:S1 family peptidase n=1 Tax=Pedobacter sp. MC2016-14 TaxID=2897327 RepID=UPI001E659AD7|nr:serine protease [Pedobacter sp. MC2016-14]MCD0486693.1 serine protease [Pedobacter sp. MC2016-14]
MQKLNLIFRTLLFVAFSLSILPTAMGQQVDPEAKKIQSMLKGNLKKAYDATVFIVGYDTVKKRPSGTRFSGVIVNNSGTIITAGHAGRTGNAYLIIFPDHKEYVAIGMGRIALYDAAVLQIKSKDTFPFSEMGWSSSLKVNEPCFSIAYPGSFSPPRSVIRLGYVAELPSARRRQIRTTCLMEPGDSGGPVFDVYGRVIGIRSNITQPLENNFDVPIDMFRKYWSALVKPQDYQFLPKADEIPIDPLANNRIYFKEPNGLSLQLAKLEEKVDKYSVQLVNSADSLQGLGVLLNLANFTQDKSFGKKTYIVSKNSIIGNQVSAKIGNYLIAAKIVYREQESDLVLLELEKKINGGLK